jgi:hypothetical protein
MREDSDRSDPAPTAALGLWWVAFTRLRPMRPAAPAIAILTIAHSPLLFLSACIADIIFVYLNKLPIKLSIG